MDIIPLRCFSFALRSWLCSILLVWPVPPSAWCCSTSWCLDLLRRVSSWWPGSTGSLNWLSWLYFAESSLFGCGPVPLEWPPTWAAFFTSQRSTSLSSLSSLAVPGLRELLKLSWKGAISYLNEWMTELMNVLQKSNLFVRIPRKETMNSIYFSFYQRRVTRLKGRLCVYHWKRAGIDPCPSWPYDLHARVLYHYPKVPPHMCDQFSSKYPAVSRPNSCVLLT